MIKYPNLPFGYTSICDDIRHEADGKITLVGIYGTKLVASEFPITLPKLCFFITVNEETSAAGARDLNIYFEPEGSEGDDDRKILTSYSYEIPEEVVSDSNGKQFSMRSNTLEIIASPFRLEEEGKIRVRINIGDDEYALGALAVVLGNAFEETKIE